MEGDMCRTNIIFETFLKEGGTPAYLNYLTWWNKLLWCITN